MGDVVSRVVLDAVGIEFFDEGNTIWVHGKEGTILRIKCTGRILMNACTAPGPHADVVVTGDIKICVPGVEEDEPPQRRTRRDPG